MAHGLEAEYQVTISARVPVQSGPPTIFELGEVFPVGNISYADELNGDGEASYSLDPGHITQDIADRFRDLRLTPCETNILRDGELIWKGPVISCQLQGLTLTINSRGLLYYLRYMTLEDDLLFDNLTDQFTIGKGLVDQYQGYDYGNYGIDTSGIGTSGTERIRRYPFIENQNVYKRLTELADIDNGFNVWVDASTRELRFANSKGTDKTDSIFADSSNILNSNVFWSVTDDDVASDAVAVGVSDQIEVLPVVGVASNVSIRQTFGRSTIFRTAEDVTQQATIDDHAAALIGSRADQMIVPGPSLVPVVDGKPNDFETGDVISYAMSVGTIGLIYTERRVRMRRVNVGEEALEDIELELL